MADANGENDATRGECLASREGEAKPLRQFVERDHVRRFEVRDEAALECHAIVGENRATDRKAQIGVRQAQSGAVIPQAEGAFGIVEVGSKAV